MNNPFSTYTAACCGTFGELYQGPFFTKDHIDIAIISALSDKKNLARFIPGEKCNLEEIGKIKVKKSLSIFFEKIAFRKIEGKWEFESDIMVGAGMSSSTSDIISALRCISSLMGIQLTLENILTCLNGVERSDTVFIDVPCLYLSQQQKIIDIYKPFRKIYCIYGIDKLPLDTCQTHDILISYYKEEQKSYKTLLDRVRQAYFENNIKKIIINSTESAQLSQGVFPKNSYEIFKKNIKINLADGIIVAHTGTLLGYLYILPPDKKTLLSTLEFIREQGLQPNYGEIF